MLKTIQRFFSRYEKLPQESIIFYSSEEIGSLLPRIHQRIYIVSKAQIHESPIGESYEFLTFFPSINFLSILAEFSTTGNVPFRRDETISAPFTLRAEKLGDGLLCYSIQQTTNLLSFTSDTRLFNDITSFF